MNDLISRSEAVQRLIQETVDSKNNLIHINTIKRLLQDVDTVYDIGEVVEELEQEKRKVQRMRNTCVALSDLEVCDIENVTYERAIKIVKQGGIRKDVE